MYEFWFNQRDQIGKTMIMVSFDPNALSDSISKYFERRDPLEKVNLLKQGKPAGIFYYRIGYNYLEFFP